MKKFRQGLKIMTSGLNAFNAIFDFIQALYEIRNDPTEVTDEEDYMAHVW